MASSRVKSLASKLQKRVNSSDSSDDEEVLGLPRYQQANFSTALADPNRRIRALVELKVLWDTTQLFQRSKAVQSAMFNDLLTAVHVQDRRWQYTSALAAVIRVAERMLPQQRRNLLSSEYKKFKVAICRAQRRGGGGAAGEIEEMEEEGVELPVDTLLLVFSMLGPYELAACSCVCRLWHERTADDNIWAPWVNCMQQYISDSASTSLSRGQLLIQPEDPHTPKRLHFANLAQRHLKELHRLTSPRLLWRGQLRWVEAMPCSISHQFASGMLLQSRNDRHSSRPLLTTEVVHWLQTGRLRDNTVGDATSDEDEEDQVPRQMRFWIQVT